MNSSEVGRDDLLASRTVFRITFAINTLPKFDLRMKYKVFKFSGIHTTFNHCLNMDKFRIICQFVNTWDQHYMSSDPILEWHHSRMWNVVWLLCLVRHCNVTIRNVARSCESRDQEARKTRGFAQFHWWKMQTLDKRMEYFGYQWPWVWLVDMCQQVHVDRALGDLWEPKIVFSHPCWS